MYDSASDTRLHIMEVRSLLIGVIGELHKRAAYHDHSKLIEPEKSVFDRVTPNLRGLTYGTPEYRACLTEMGEALEHHYRENRHHPEHWPDEGMRGMDLVDLVEMFCDWAAATRRHDDGDLATSIAINAERFSYDDPLRSIFLNTARTRVFK